MRSADPRFKQPEHRPNTTRGSSKLQIETLNSQCLQVKKAAELAQPKRKSSGRSKSLSDVEKEHQKYVRWLYSSSWRIHGELLNQIEPNGPEMGKQVDVTQTLFYKTKTERPDTFIFDPNWV